MSPGDATQWLHRSLCHVIEQPESLALLVHQSLNDLRSTLSQARIEPFALIGYSQDVTLVIVDLAFSEQTVMVLKERNLRFRPLSAQIMLLPKMAAQSPLAEPILASMPTDLTDDLSAAVASGTSLVLEMGPQPFLAGSNRGVHLETSLEWIPSQLHRGDGRRGMLTAASRLYLTGVGVQWDALYRLHRCRRLRLPTYPFESERYWIEGPDLMSLDATERVRRSDHVPLHPLLDAPTDADWLDAVQEFLVAP